MSRLRKTSREGSVLVVDDEAYVCKAIVRYLKRYHHVDSALTMEQGFTLLENQPYDVIFCDMKMDRHTGKDFYEAVQERWPGLEEQIIFMSGGMTSDWEQEFLTNNPQPLLDKPFDLNDLKEITLQFIQKKELRLAT